MSNWSKLAGYCSAQGIPYASEDKESDLKKAIKKAGKELPKEKTEIKKVIKKLGFTVLLSISLLIRVKTASKG